MPSLPVHRPACSRHLRLRRLFQQLWSAPYAGCLTTGCCVGGSSAKKSKETRYGRTCGGLAGGRVLVASRALWRASLSCNSVTLILSRLPVRCPGVPPLALILLCSIVFFWKLKLQVFDILLLSMFSSPCTFYASSLPAICCCAACRTTPRTATTMWHAIRQAAAPITAVCLIGEIASESTRATTWCVQCTCLPCCCVPSTYWRARLQPVAMSRGRGYMTRLQFRQAALVQSPTPPKQYSARSILVLWKYLYLTRLLTR